MVAVKAHEADRALSRLDPSWLVVLIYGPDQGLVSERSAALARAATGGSDDPFLLVRLDGADLCSDPMRLIDEANTIGLFGGRRVIRVSPAPRPMTAAVAPLLKDPPRNALIILEAGDLQRSHALRVMIEKSPVALAAPCYSDDARSIDALIDPILKEHGLQIDRDARALLVSRLGADRQLSRREIEKLAIYSHGGTQVRNADIEAVVGDMSARDIDDVIDCAFAGDSAGLDHAYTRLRAGGADPGTLLVFALRHALSLIGPRGEMERSNRSASEVATGVRGVPFPRKPAIEAALRRLTTDQLSRIVIMLDSALIQARFTPALSSQLTLRALWNIRRG